MRMTRMLLTAVVGLCLLGAFARLSPALAVNISIQTVPEYDTAFERTDGWTGADGAYSVALAKDITLWLFSDTWVGPVVDGRHKGATMVNNSVAIQRGPRPTKDNVKFYWGKGENAKPEALIKPADGVGWFWIFDGVVADGKLYLFLTQIVKAGRKGVFNFKQTATWLGEIDNPMDEPTNWRIKQHKIPFGRYSEQGNTFVGSAAMGRDKLIYLYGVKEDWSKGFGGRSMILTAVRIEETMTDFAAWRFLSRGEWVHDISAATGFLDGIAAEYSVSFQPGIRKFVMIYTENGMSKNILMRTSPMPVGPWSPPQKIYECPEDDWHDTYFCYAAKGHPEISAEDELIVTYVCNSMDFRQMAKDARIYRPRFLRIKFDVRRNELTTARTPAGNEKKEKQPPGEEFPRELVDFSACRDNPLFGGTGKDTWDRNIRERGYILREEDTYHLWYTGYNKNRSKTLHLGYATSADGLKWTRHPDNPIFDESWVEDMQVVKYQQTYYMFAEGLNDIAHILSSTDKIHWQDHGSIDVRCSTGEPLSPGPYGTPTVWVEGKTWYLFYERNDEGIWLATSTDRKVWTNVQDEPVISKGPEDYDRAAVALNQVIKYKGRYYGYYHATGHTPWRDWTSNVAVSRDLVHWKKYPKNPIVTGNKSSPILVHDGNRYQLYTMHPDVRVYFPRDSR